MKSSKNNPSLFKTKQFAVFILVGIAVFAAALYSASLDDTTNSAISGRSVQVPGYGVEFSEIFNLNVIGPDNKGTLNPKTPFLITNIVVETNEIVANPTIILKQYRGLIPGIRPLPWFEFKYFTIESENIPERNLNRITIEFNVPKSWFSENKINPEQIFMYNYKDSWELLETTYLRGDIQYNYYKASAYSFSPLAIGGQLTVETPVLMGGYCGDGICQATESCSTCPADCGPCKTKVAIAPWIILVLAAAAIAIGFIFFMSKQRKVKTASEYTPPQKLHMPEVPPKTPTSKKAKKMTYEQSLHILVDYIQEMVKQGHNVPDIRREILNSEWSNRDSRNAFRLAIIPPENEDDLENYVEQVMKHGFSKAAVKKRLLEAGWDPEMVNHLLRLVSERLGTPKAQ